MCELIELFCSVRLKTSTPPAPGIPEFGLLKEKIEARAGVFVCVCVCVCVCACVCVLCVCVCLSGPFFFLIVFVVASQFFSGPSVSETVTHVFKALKINFPDL